MLLCWTNLLRATSSCLLTSSSKARLLSQGQKRRLPNDCVAPAAYAAMLIGGSKVIAAVIGFLAGRMREQLALLRAFRLETWGFYAACVRLRTD